MCYTSTSTFNNKLFEYDVEDEIKNSNKIEKNDTYL